MLKSSGRRIDISQPFVDAMLPEGHRLHVVLEGISRGFSAVNIRKFVLRAARLDDLVELGTPARRRPRGSSRPSVRAGLNILVAGGTQAGKTTMLNCLAAAIPGGDRVVSAEEVFELRFPHPDWVPMQTRQAGLEGTGEITLRDLVKESLRMRPSRIIVGEVRAEECLDLLLALNAGLPGMCTIHANSAREALVKMCTLPLLAGENISARFVVPTVAALGRPRRPPRHRPARRTPGQRDRRRPGPGRERRHRDRADLRAARRRARARRRDAAAARALRAGGHRRPPDPGEARLMGALVGLGVGVGLLLIWSAFFLPRTAAAAPRSPAGCGRCSTRPGSGEVSRRPASWCCCVGAGRRRRRWCIQVVSRTPPVAVAFGADGRLPAGGRASRAGRAGGSGSSPRSGRRRSTTWPPPSAPGCRCPRRWPASAPAGRSRCATRSTSSRSTTRSPAGSASRLDRLKDRLADPVGDRVVEGLRIAREVGGGDLGRLLRNLSGYLRDDARTRSELEARQAWTVNGARLAVAAPWLVLLLHVASSPR